MKKYYVIILIVLMPVLNFSQSHINLQIIESVPLSGRQEKSYTYTSHIQQIQEKQNEKHGTLQVMFKLLFSGYKKFISSQDVNNCPFTPSCSEYFMLSLYHHGFIKGLLNGMDRLMRCNGTDMQHYHYDKSRNTYIDLPTNIDDE